MLHALALGAPGSAGLGALSADPGAGTCTIPQMKVGQAFTASILGIPWPMKISGVATGGGIYYATPDSSMMKVPKSKVPGPIAAAVQHILAYYLPRVAMDFPALKKDPAELLKIAKVRAGFYAGQAVFDKYKQWLGRDAVANKTMTQVLHPAPGGIALGPRRWAILGRITAPCKGRAMIFSGGQRVVACQDLGSYYGITLYDPPDKNGIEQLLDLVTSPLAAIFKPIANLLAEGVDAMVDVFKWAFEQFCALAQGEAAKLFDEYLDKIQTFEGKVGSGSLGPVNTSGINMTGAIGATGDVGYYSVMLKAVAGKYCPKPPAPKPPPKPAPPPPQVIPWYKRWQTYAIAGGAAASVGTAVVVARRR